MDFGSDGVHPNAQAVIEAEAAFSRGDLEAVQNFLADDVVWRWPGRHRASGTYRGRDQVLAFMRRGKQATEDTLTVEPIDVLASDNHVFVFSHVQGERDGKQLDAIRAVCYVMNENHQATEMFTLLGDQAAEDEFFS